AVSDLVLDLKGEPSDAKGRLHAETTMTADTRVLALRADTTGVTSLEVKARRPDGATDVLLFAKGFSSKWPTPFVLAEPVALRRGTTLSATAYTDSTAGPTTVRLVVSTSR